MSKFFQYGETVEGYDRPVLNEREARAGAGILFAIGLLSLSNAVMLSHGIVTRFFISFFTLDFLIRVINPRYAPSLLLGRFFVQDQTPEYVGAAQKRFAWGLGLLLALPMFYLLVIHWQPNPLKVFICIVCLVLLFMESAFSICLGCKLYNLIMPQKATYCPGGVCEVRTKAPIQRFDTVQKVILLLTTVMLFAAAYGYFYKIENKTHIGRVVSEAMMSEAELKALEERRYQEELEAFEDDDDF